MITNDIILINYSLKYHYNFFFILKQICKSSYKYSDKVSTERLSGPNGALGAIVRDFYNLRDHIEIIIFQCNINKKLKIDGTINAC